MYDGGAPTLLVLGNVASHCGNVLLQLNPLFYKRVSSLFMCARLSSCIHASLALFQFRKLFAIFHSERSGRLDALVQAQGDDLESFHVLLKISQKVIILNGSMRV